MAVPKRRTSTHRKGRRRATHALKLPEVSLCPSCGSYKRPHYVCPSCGKLDSGKKPTEPEREKVKPAAGKKTNRNQKKGGLLRKVKNAQS